jgi:uncharacterized membrane protein
VRKPDSDRIRKAIDAAERGTTGRIAVRITPDRSADALEDAQRHFMHARMHEHEHRNSVIFFVAPNVKKFAVFGDKAIHDHVGEAFWKQLVEEMTPYFAGDNMTEGLALGIARVGEQLRKYFPARADVTV